MDIHFSPSYPVLLFYFFSSYFKYFFFYFYFFYFIFLPFPLPKNETLDISLGVLPGDSHLVFWIRVRDSPEKGEIQEGVGAH